MGSALGDFEFSALKGTGTVVCPICRHAATRLQAAWWRRLLGYSAFGCCDVEDGCPVGVFYLRGVRPYA